MFCKSALRTATFAVFQRLNTHPAKRFKKIRHHAIGVAIEAGSKAAPEAPADAFENALPTHILPPLLRAVKTITIAFDRQTSSVRSLNHHVDAEAKRSNLALNPITALQKPSHHVAFKVRFTQRQNVASFFRPRHRVFKMSNEPRF